MALSSASPINRKRRGGPKLRVGIFSDDGASDFSIIRTLISTGKKTGVERDRRSQSAIGYVGRPAPLSLKSPYTWAVTKILYTCGDGTKEISSGHNKESSAKSSGKTLNNYTKLCINLRMTKPSKALEFRGSSLDDLRRFPILARREAGYQLDKVQSGLDPSDWKPMTTVGKGVREIRIRDVSGAFRILYITKFAEAVYVLHCFEKKTQATSKPDIDLAASRYKDLLKELCQ